MVFNVFEFRLCLNIFFYIKMDISQEMRICISEKNTPKIH